MSEPPEEGADPKFFALVRRAQSDSAVEANAAWNELESPVRPLVAAAVRTTLAGQGTRLDRATVVLEALAHVQQNIRKCRLGSKKEFQGWIRVVTRRYVLDRLRRVSRQGHEQIDPAELDDVDPSAEEGRIYAEAKELSDRVPRALEELTEIQRQVIVLRYIEGNPLNAVAERLGISETNARYHHKVAMQRLRRKLGGFED